MDLLGIMSKKNYKFYIYIFRNAKLIIVTKETRSHRTYILILKLCGTSAGCQFFADLFISRLIHYIFLFNYQVFMIFPVFFNFLFVSLALFMFFNWTTASSCKYTHCHYCVLELLSNLGSD